MEIAKAIVIIVAVAVFLVGFAICAFPLIQNIVMDNELKQDVQNFLGRLGTTSTEDPTILMEQTALPRKYQLLWDDMVAYNRRLWEEKQSGLRDSWAYQQPSFTLEDYGLKDEVFGVISIPSLDLEMPLYLGATPAHTAKGAAHLSQTSLPIGGVNTNCVIAGHRGYWGADFFRYITDLEPGDKVIITNLWETMTYTVTETKIIMPSDVDQILIREGRDMITLLTCHPYASGGKQRYLVFCDRVVEVASEYN